MALQLDVFLDYYPLILQGFMVTMAIAVLAFAGGLAIGVIIALLRLSRIAACRWIAAIYVEIFRNVPFLIEVFFLYYVLPFYGVRLPALTVGVIALAAYVGAYYAEIIRGAIQSIPADQVEAARAVGMSRREALRHIVVPQMFGVLLPPLTSQTLSMVKETAILSTITVKEGTMAALVVQGITFRPFEAFMMVGLLYWGFTAVLSVAALRLELILQPYKQHAARSGMVALAPPLPVAIGR
jgi:His/Glu/Gln/Arg/opine family amino acid ABC transporter permease subunit